MASPPPWSYDAARSLYYRWDGAEDKYVYQNGMRLDRNGTITSPSAGPEQQSTVAHHIPLRPESSPRSGHADQQRLFFADQQQHAAQQPSLGQQNNMGLQSYIAEPHAGYEQYHSGPPQMVGQYQAQQLHTQHPSSKGKTETTVDLNSVRIVGAFVGRLDSRYTVIRNPRKYFTRGRIVMTLWSEPRSVTGWRNQNAPDAEIFLKIRRFVVIRSKPKHCLCLLITTYSSQATSKQSISPDDHAALVLQGQPVKLHRSERRLNKAPIHFKLEDSGVFVDPMSRIDFSKIYTLEYTVKVRTVGRVISEDLEQLEAYFQEQMRIMPSTQKAAADPSLEVEEELEDSDQHDLPRNESGEDDEGDEDEDQLEIVKMDVEEDQTGVAEEENEDDDTTDFPILVTAISSRTERKSGELSFNSGDKIIVEEWSDKAWGRGKNTKTGQKGSFRRKHIRIDN